MDLGEYINLIWFFAALALMYAAKTFLPEPASTIVGFASLFLMIGGVFLSKYYAIINAAPYRHIDVLVRPYWRRMHIFYTKAESYPLGNGRYLTKVYHAPISSPHPVYGRCECSYWLHNGEWSKRFRFRQANIFHLGNFIKHGQTDYAVAYEYADRPAFIDRSKPYPLFELIEAGGDYPEMGYFVRGYKPKEEVEWFEAKIETPSGVKKVQVVKRDGVWFYENGERVEEDLASEFNKLVSLK
jgi:hypothetical protein